MRLDTDIAAQAERAEVVALDLSPLAAGDLANLCLQRSEVLFDIPRSGRIVRAWKAGDDAPLEAVVAKLGDRIARRAAAVIFAEFEALRPVLDSRAPQSLADIGCGYGFFALFMAQTYGCCVTLIDLEQSDRRHFGFEADGAAYSSLSVARALLEANGIAPDRIATINPGRDDPLAAAPVDLAASFLSCGFHYPVDQYLAFFRDVVRPTGAVLLDLRAATAKAQLEVLAPLGTVENLPSPDKARRILLRRNRT